MTDGAVAPFEVAKQARELTQHLDAATDATVAAIERTKTLIAAYEAAGEEEQQNVAEAFLASQLHVAQVLTVAKTTLARFLSTPSTGGGA